MKTNNTLFSLGSRFVKSLALATILLMNCKGKVDPTPPPIVPPVVPPVVLTNEVDFWLTKSDESIKLQKQTAILAFGTTANQFASIEVDEGTTYQTIDGFGYTLTGGSAEVINSLSTAKKQELLQELFGSAATSIGV